MSKKYSIDYGLVDFFGTDSRKQYVAVFMTSEGYGRLVMEAFYIPLHSAGKLIKRYFHSGEIDLQFMAYREIAVNAISFEGRRKITSFTVEEVTYPLKLAEIARAYLSYRKTPKD